MQKIILSDKVLGLLIGRLKNFFAGEVVETEHEDSVLPKKVAGLPINLDVSDWWIAMVSSHWMLNDTLRVRRGEPRPMIHVSNTESWATFFREGDEFYFFGTRTIVVRRVNSSTKWDDQGNNIPTISRFVLKRTRHEITNESRANKIMQLEWSHEQSRAWEEEDPELDDMSLDQVADQMQEVSDQQREDDDNQRRADERFDRMFEGDY